MADSSKSQRQNTLAIAALAIGIVAAVLGLSLNILYPLAVGGGLVAIVLGVLAVRRAASGLGHAALLLGAVALIIGAMAANRVQDAVSNPPQRDQHGIHTYGPDGTCTDLSGQPGHVIGSTCAPNTSVQAPSSSEATPAR